MFEILSTSQLSLKLARTTKPYALRRFNAARLRNWIRREVSSVITPDCTNWVKVRDTVSMVSPR
jgi:hypothetical protein